MGERISVADMGTAGVIDEQEKARQEHENSRQYREKIGNFSKKEARFKLKLKSDYGISDDEADSVIKMFKKGEITYKVFSEYPDIVRDKLKSIKRYTDV